MLVGAGQTGLQIAARFRQLSIPTLVVDKAARVGDQWRARYPTLSLHTPRQHSSFLYQPFPTNWPIYTPRTKLANWMESYSITQDMIIWNKACILAAPAPTYDEPEGRWTLIIDHDGTHKTVRPAHVILATGTLGRPYLPDIPSMSNFHGEAIHACQFQGGRAYKGKRVLVVGAGNTAADVSQDIHSNGGAEMTILQRTTTCLVSSEWSKDTFAKNFPDHQETDVSDFKLAGTPWGLLEQIALTDAAKKVDIDAELKKKLHEKGFRTNEGPRGLGRSFLVVERFAGKNTSLPCAK
jgi:cation diffusion facilitator CzcD-associated flavoprotein CzcO